MSDISSPPVLSVIVTSYNIENYLAQCLAGILAQTVDDMEVIVVDDGSSDASPQIVRDYAARDSRVVPVLFDDNTPGGVATAANAGLDRAQGEYVGFADGDDLYDPTMFAKLLSAARDHDADLAMCQYQLLNDDTGAVTDPADVGRWTNLSRSVYDLDTETTKQFLAFIAVPWRKLYRRSMLEDHSLRFPVGDYFYEDNPFHWFTVVSAGRIAVVPEVLCQHRVDRPGQTMQTADSRLFKIFQHHDTIRAWLDRNGLTEDLGPTLLTWVIAQMEWITRKTPPELRAELFGVLRHIFGQYDRDQVDQSFRESGKGSRARDLVSAVVDDSLARFNNIIDNRQQAANPIQSGLYHLRNTGVTETGAMTRRYLTNKMRQARRRLTNRQAGDQEINNEDLMMALMVLDQRLRSVEDQLTVLSGQGHDD